MARRWEPRRLALPTLVVNTLGSGLAGALAAWAGSSNLPPTLVAFLGVGLLGGFTTFSTFAYETVRLAEDGATGSAILNVSASYLLAGIAAWVGYTLAQVKV